MIRTLGKVRIVALGMLFVAPTGMLFTPTGARSAAAADPETTTFQHAIRAWMSVVALVAEAGEAEHSGTVHHGMKRDEKAEGDNAKRDAGHAERHGRRDGRGRDDAESRRPGMPPRSEAWNRERGSRGPGGMSPAMGMRMGMPMGSMPGMRSDVGGTLREIAERLSRIERKLDAAPRMGNPWSPRPELSRSGRSPRPEMSDDVRRAIEQRMKEGRTRMAEAREKMEQARKKFQEMEERIRRLEAEVERLKAGK